MGEAEQQLGAFEAKWDETYPSIGQTRRRNWPRLIPFLDYPPEIRKAIYTTNAIEPLNMSLRKITKNRGLFPNDEVLTKLFYLAIRNISKKLTMPIQVWKTALDRFIIQFESECSSINRKPVYTKFWTPSACNLPLALKAIGADPVIGLLPPCYVVVLRTAGQENYRRLHGPDRGAEADRQSRDHAIGRGSVRQAGAGAGQAVPRLIHPLPTWPIPKR